MYSFGEFLSEFFSSDVVRNVFVFGGLCVAIVSVLTSRQIARRKQTADLLQAARGDKKLQDGYRIFKTYHEATDKKIEHIARSEEEESEWTKVLYLLNHFESVAIGVRHGIYDETMLKEAWFTLLCKTYNSSKALISSLRGSSDTFYQEFERLACRWEEKPLKKLKTKRVVSR